MSLARRQPEALVRTVDYALPASSEREQSFLAIYERVYPRLLDLARRFLDDADAEDAVQEALADIWKRWPVLEAERPTLAYFCRAVRNQIANSRRNEHRHRVRLASYLTSYARKSRARNATDAYLDEEELAALIELTLANMPERCREAWSLVREHEQDYVAVGDIMGVEPQSAKKYVMRAQALMRDALDAGGYTQLSGRAHRQLPPAAGGNDND